MVDILQVLPPVAATSSEFSICENGTRYEVVNYESSDYVIPLTVAFESLGQELVQDANDFQDLLTSGIQRICTAKLQGLGLSFCCR